NLRGVLDLATTTSYRAATLPRSESVSTPHTHPIMVASRRHRYPGMLRSQCRARTRLRVNHLVRVWSRSRDRILARTTAPSSTTPLFLTTYDIRSIGYVDGPIDRIRI